MPRLCLITPRHLSTNPRIVKEADALQEAGFEVEVIAGDFSTWGREADREFASRPWASKQRLTFGPLAPRTLRLRQVARRAAAQRLFGWGVKTPAVITAAFDPVAPDLVRAALATPADLYIAHYDAALPAAAEAARRHGARFAFDAEDYHPGDLENLPHNKRENDLIQAIEALYLPSCSHITAGSRGIAEAYARTYGVAAPRVLLNVFARRDAPAAPSLRGSEARRPSIYWFSQTIGLDRGLQAAVRAIARASTKPHLFLRGSLSASVASVLDTLARDLGVADRLHFLQPGAPNEMVRLAADYDVGLVGETGATHNRRIALTNKQFTYLLAGLPILMSDVPAHREFALGLGEVAHLYAVDDDVQLAQKMDDALGDPARLAAARAHAWRLGQERYNWDVEKHTLLNVVESSLAGQPAAAPAEAAV